MKDKIFELYCQFTASAMNIVSTLPSTTIAKHFNITLYKARKYIKELVNEDLLVSNIEILNFDREEPPTILRGYCLTKKGFETEIYKQKLKEEIDYWNGGFLEDIEVE